MRSVRWVCRQALPVSAAAWNASLLIPLEYFAGSQENRCSKHAPCAVSDRSAANPAACARQRGLQSPSTTGMHCLISENQCQQCVGSHCSSIRNPCANKPASSVQESNKFLLPNLPPGRALQRRRVRGQFRSADEMRGMFDRFLRRRLLAMPKPALAMIKTVASSHLDCTSSLQHCTSPLCMKNCLRTIRRTSCPKTQKARIARISSNSWTRMGGEPDPTPTEQCLENFKLSVPNCAATKSLRRILVHHLMIASALMPAIP